MHLYQISEDFRNPGESDIFRNDPRLPWDTSSLLSNGYRVSSPKLRRPERGFDYPPSFNAKVKQTAELHLYTSSGSSWPVIKLTLHFIL
jgi:hypothetical protein